jgi:hypothetical protein
MKVLVENCTWANIGDGFYQMSVTVMLQRLFPHWDIYQQDGPQSRSFRYGPRFAPNVLNLMDYQRADLHVFTGPVVGQQLLTRYRKIIETITRRGDRYALISCSGSMIQDKYLEEQHRFFKDNPPVVFATRDPMTYQMFADDVPSAYDGVCAAWFVNQLPVDEVDLGGPFFNSTFYDQPEPEFHFTDANAEPPVLALKPRKNLLGLPWTKAKQFEGFLRTYPSEVSGLRIVRPRHATTSRYAHLNFRAPNSYVSSNPLHYLALYKSARFTVSDRVHACVASLAFGRPAKLLFHDNRCSLFDRVGLDAEARKGFMQLDPAVLQREQQALEQYLVEQLGSLDSAASSRANPQATNV